MDAKSVTSDSKNTQKRYFEVYDIYHMEEENNVSKKVKTSTEST